MVAKYTLYVDKEKALIKITKAAKIFENCEFTDEPKRYNDKYVFCNNRKELKRLASEIKNKWIQEAESRLLFVNSITF